MRSCASRAQLTRACMEQIELFRSDGAFGLQTSTDARPLAAPARHDAEGSRCRGCARFGRVDGSPPGIRGRVLGA